VKIARFGLDVGDLNSLFYRHRAAERSVGGRADHRFAPTRLSECRWRSMQGHSAESLALAQVERAKLGLADAHRVCQHGLKYRLKLAPRTADDLEHLGGRALLLQCLGKVPPRLGELTGARLKLLLQLARVRLELLFRRSLGFLRRVKMTHVGRPRARICRSETIP